MAESLSESFSAKVESLGIRESSNFPEVFGLLNYPSKISMTFSVHFLLGELVS